MKDLAKREVYGKTARVSSMAKAKERDRENCNQWSPVSKAGYVLLHMNEKGERLFSSDRILSWEMFAPSQGPDESCPKQEYCAASTSM